MTKIAHKKIEIGKRIKKHRLANELSQQELAAKAGISQQALSSFESGRRQPRNLASIAAALNVAEKDLMYSEQELQLNVEPLLGLGAEQNIGARIKEAREKLGISQTNLAQKLGLTRQAISGFERDENSVPRNIESLASILNVSPIWLRFGIDMEGMPINDKINRKISCLTLDQLIHCCTIPALRDLIKKETVMTVDVLCDPKTINENAELFAIRLPHIDSMMGSNIKPQHLLPEGANLILDINREPKNESIVLVYHEGNTYIRQYILDGGNVQLKPNNPQYPMLHSNETTKILAVGVQIVLDIS